MFTWLDEFLEAHGKELVVREAIGASLPLAGVGCAISRDALERIAAARGAPFDPECLTEDSELGLSLGALGGRAAFVRLPSGPGRPVVATRALFPGDRKAAISQKTVEVRNTIGAAPAIEAAVCIRALGDQLIPPTVHYRPDPELDLDYVPHQGRAARLDLVMSASFGFGGTNCVLIFRRWPDD